MCGDEHPLPLKNFHSPTILKNLLSPPPLDKGLTGVWFVMMVCLFLLAQEADGRVLKTFTISVKDKDRENSSWKKFSVESQASLIKPLPLPVGGALVVGAETIAYYSQEVQHTIDTPIIKVRHHRLVSTPKAAINTIPSSLV